MISSFFRTTNLNSHTNRNSKGTPALSNQRVLLALLLPCLALGLLTGCGRAEYLRPTSQAQFSFAIPDAQVREAVVRAASSRRWTVVSEGAGQAVVQLNHGNRQLTLQVDYNGGGYVLSYLSSANLGYRVQGTQATISRRYSNYVRQFHSLIQRELGRTQPGMAQPVAVTDGNGTPVAQAPPAAEPNVPAGYAAEGTHGVSVVEQNSEGATPVQEPAPAATDDGVTCEQSVTAHGHAADQQIYCRDADTFCAAALLRAGHAPTELPHCRGVTPSCAETILDNGMAPSELIRCR